MKLYKNVDICDLESILSNGILSIDESGNNNWNDGRRANNPTDRVYLFQPIDEKPNSFPNYGAALLEVDVDSAEISEMRENDRHKNDYNEYTIGRVTPEEIKAIYIPELFKNNLGDIPDDIKKRVSWCGMRAEEYGEDDLEEASEETLKEFAATASIKCSASFNFFRGTRGREVIDLYNISYLI